MRSYAAPLAFAADLVCVLVFVVIGRIDHESGTALAGIWGTAWPFLAGTVLGWAATRAWRSPARIWPVGVCVWAVTVAGGTALRLATGEGAPPSFVVVTSLFLAATLLGWRAVALLVARSRRKAGQSGA